MFPQKAAAELKVRECRPVVPAAECASSRDNRKVIYASNFTTRLITLAFEIQSD